MNLDNNSKPVRILMIEDSMADVELTREALDSSKLLVDLQVAYEGNSAIELLNKMKEEEAVPDMIFLDLNLPGKSGTEVLSVIRGTEGIKRIPVVILTSSKAESDIIRSYDLHANCYVTKPIDFDQFINVVRSIEDFWFTIVKLPGRL